NDPGVSTTSELFALACGPTSTPISVKSCIVNGVRFVVHNLDEHHTTQNNSICSPRGKDGEMYYGQLQEILEFSYLSFKVVLFRVKWFDTSNEGRKDNATLHIDGQSTEVDALPDIIDLDEDDDIIDDEDALLHDLAYFDDEDLVNVDDDGVDMSTLVARGHDGDGGGDDHPPTHHIPTSCGGCFINRGLTTWRASGSDIPRTLPRQIRMPRLPSGMIPGTKPDPLKITKTGQRARSGSGGYGDDDMADGEDEEDEEDGDNPEPLPTHGKFRLLVRPLMIFTRSRMVDLIRVSLSDPEPLPTHGKFRLLVRPLMIFTRSLGNNSVFRSFFEKQKLTGPNFIDWYRQLCLVLSTEDKENYLEHHILAAPVTPPGQQVPPEALAAHAAWVKGQKEVDVLMLLTMDLEIQRNLAHLGAYDMLHELKAMYSKQAEQELLQTMREFHTSKQEEGQSVSSHVLKMKGYIDNLERLDQPVGQNLAVSLILVSLNKDFDSFMQNYNMHGMGKTVNELHAMLKLHEETLPKKDANPALHAIRAGRGLRESKKLKPGALSLYVGDGHHAAVEATGTYHLDLPSGLVIVLNNCHYTTSITRGVISVSRLFDNGFINHFDDNNVISVFKNNLVYFMTVPQDGIYEIDMSCSNTNDSSMYAITNKRAKINLDSSLLWHCRLGHISKKRIEKLQHDGLLNSIDIESLGKCVSCISGKMARKPYSHQVEMAKDLLGLIHTNVCGPFKIMSRQGASYFVTFTNDFSRYGYVYLLKHKHEVFETFKVFQKEVENQLGKTIKSLRSDRRDLELIQEEDTNPSIDTSLNHEEDDQEIDEPQSDINPIRKSSRTRRSPYRMCLYIDAEEHELGDLGEPANYKAALLDPEFKKWLDAMNVEMQSMKDNDVWVLVELPPNARTVRSKWLFKKKTDMDGAVNIFKARLVAKGFTQTYGVDYEETFFSYVKSNLGRSFAMKDLGEAAYILGIKIYRDRSKRLIGLCQKAYIEKILKRFYMENSKRGTIPMQKNIKLSKLQGASTPAEKQLMQNIPYASANPGEEHWTAVKNNLKYLRNTKDIFLVNGDDEYIAAFDASKEAVWICKFISGLGIVPIIEEPISMYCDNTGAIAIAKDDGVTKGARHFRAKVHYIHETIKLGDVKIEKIDTDDNLADPFINALAFPKHSELTRNIGLLPASSFM
nr:zinc finger, CCHC-type [Tanacetum cinerariifolium]